MRFCWDARISFVVTAVLFLIMEFASSARASDTAIIPEYYLKSQNVPYCVVRVAIKSQSERARQQLFMRFIKSAYSETDGWKKRYALLGVDYAEFQFFHIIAFSRCNTLSSLLTHLSKIFDRCEAGHQTY